MNYRSAFNFSLLFIYLTAVFLSGCNSKPSDPIAERKEQIALKLKKSKNLNVVFGVDKTGMKKENITLTTLGNKLEELEALNFQTKSTYSATKDYLTQQLRNNSTSTFLRNDSLFNEHLRFRVEQLKISLGQQKVYEGKEMENAYWLIGNQIEQITIIKEEIEKLNAGKN